MKPWHQFIDNIFVSVFSETKQNKVERATLWLSNDWIYYPSFLNLC